MCNVRKVMNITEIIKISIIIFSYYELYKYKKATFFIKSRILGKGWKDLEGNFL